jgi:hypothetical protein
MLPLELNLVTNKETVLISQEVFLNKRGIGVRKSEIDVSELKKVLDGVNPEWEFAGDVVDIMNTANQEMNEAINNLEKYFGKIV